MEEDVCKIYTRQCKLDHRKRGHIRIGLDDLRSVLQVSGKESCLDAEQMFLDPTLNKIPTIKRLLVAIFHRSLRIH